MRFYLRAAYSACGDLSVALSFKNVLLEANIPCVYDVYVCFQPGPTSEPVELSHDPNLPSSISSFRIEVETNEVSTEFVPYVPRICLKDLKVACTACACANTSLSGPTLWAPHKSFGCCHMPSLEWLIAADVLSARRISKAVAMAKQCSKMRPWLESKLQVAIGSCMVLLKAGWGWKCRNLRHDERYERYERYLVQVLQVLMVFMIFSVQHTHRYAFLNVVLNLKWEHRRRIEGQDCQGNPAINPCSCCAATSS